MESKKILGIGLRDLDVELISESLRESGVEYAVDEVSGEEQFLASIRRMEYGLVLSDSHIPGYSCFHALKAVRRSRPDLPFVVLSSSSYEEEARIFLNAGATDYVPKDELWRLTFLVKRIAEREYVPSAPTADFRENPSVLRLVKAMQELSSVRSLDDIIEIVRHTARELVDADGASFVLKKGDKTYYADEDAIKPIFKGKTFPAKACIGGWSMINREQVVIDNVFQDARIPYEVYKPTFIKSLIMTPIRKQDPIAAIGVYWAVYHKPSSQEVFLMQTLADTTSLAMENVRLMSELEDRVQKRTVELRSVVDELQGFIYSVSHDFRAPVRAISNFAGILKRRRVELPEAKEMHYLGNIISEADRMNLMMEDMLRLFRLSTAPVDLRKVNVSLMAQDIIDHLRLVEPERRVETFIEPGIEVVADRGLMHILLQNLLSNAWKFTSREETAKIEVGKTVSGNREKIYVKDNGAGFQMKYADKLFEPFQRYHSDREFGGTGVGLAIVKRIVNRHNGLVWAESEVGAGTTVSFSLSS
ncbi:MAG: sensor histidine kinase [Chitinispirillaceae bacterium]